MNTPGLKSDPATFVRRLAGVRTVTKPWGEERWLVSEEAKFGFKVISIRAGCRTSLQYHRRKEEAALVLCGQAVLFVGCGSADALTALPLSVGDIMHLPALTVHRIRAVTDVRLAEVSTPDLDDVVRLADDYGRPDGRIRAEHPLNDQ